MGDLLLLFALGLVVNGAVAALTSSPGYTDAYYYANGGTWFVAWLTRGRPLTEPYLWNYAAAPPALPTPAFAYWQPLPSMIAALGMVAFPALPPFDAAQIPFVLLAAILPLIAYIVGMRLGERRYGLLAGLLTIFSGYYVIYGALTESFTPFAAAAAGALALASWGRVTGRRIAWALSGGCAALAHLARADGVLVIGVVALIASFPPAALPLKPTRGSRGQVNVALSLLTYLLVMAPWLARNIAVFGSVQPPGGLSTLWLIDYNDLFSYPAHLTPARYLAAGLPVILRAKGAALLGNLATFVGAQNLIFMTPFSLIGLGRRWRQEWLLPAALYGAALFVAMTFAFTLPGVRGGWLHSGAALVPFLMAAGAAGLNDAIRWVAQRRSGWNVANARKVFSGAATVFALALTLWLVARSVIGLPFSEQIAWNQADAVYGEIGAALDEMGVSPTTPVMVNNPPGFYWHTGHGGVPLPSGDETMLLRAADAYRVSYLVVDQNVAAPLIPLYEDGPESERLALLKTFGSASGPVYLYRIAP